MAMLALLLALLLGTCLAHITTAAPSLALRYVHTEDYGVFGNLREHLLFKRQDQCDQSEFICPIGTCFTDATNGYIGCCSVSSCAPRTSCIEYNPTISLPCDPNTGGCLYCSDADNPYCLKITNIGANQWIEYCATIATTETLSYVNVITTGSQWEPSSTVSLTSTSSSFSIASSTASATSSSITSSSNSSTSSAPTLASSLTNVVAGTAVSISNVSSPSQSSGTTAVSGGAIGGAVAGSVFGISAIVAGIWMLRRRSPSGSKHEPGILGTFEKAPIPPPSGTDEDPAEAEGSTPKHVAQYFSPDGVSQYHEADSRPVTSAPHSAVQALPHGLGIRPAEQVSRQSVSRYTISNPDEPSPKTESQSGQASPFVSPVMSQHENSEPSQTLSPVPSTPMQQRYNQDTPYSPSLYAADPPGSVWHTNASRPPSLPQPYSVAALPAGRPGGDQAEPVHEVYRGLSGRTGETRAPWAYLSPEAAVNGGWMNNPDKSV